MKMQLTPINTSKSGNATKIWTIGHSNRSQQTFLELLREHDIEALIDVRSFPTSKIDHFKRREMERWLPEYEIEYVWLGRELGGYRHGGYKAHTRTEMFKEGIEKLNKMAAQKRTCIMCMETNPKYCHRRYISARLEKQGIDVIHVVAKGQTALMSFNRLSSSQACNLKEEGLACS